MKIRRQRKHRSRAQRREKRLREGRLWYLTDEEDGRALALDPNTPSETLFQLAAFFPKEVRRNPSFSLTVMAFPADWKSQLEEHQKGPIVPPSPGQKSPRRLENLTKTHRFRRHQKRSAKRKAYYVQQLAAGRSLSSIVQSIQKTHPTP